MLQPEHPLRLGHHGGQLHALEGDLRVPTGPVKGLVAAGGLQLLRARQVRGHLDAPDPAGEAVDLAPANLVVDLEHRAGHHVADVPGVAVSPGHVVKIHEEVVQVAAHGVDVDVVDVALGPVEEQAAHAVQRLLHPPAQEPGPVRREPAAAHHVGVVPEVDQNDVRRAFPLEAQHVHPVVHLADGGEDVRVVDARIGADAAVAHAEAPDEGDARGAAGAAAHAGGLEVLHRRAGGVGEASLQPAGVFRHGGVVALAPEGGGVGVGGGDEHAFRRDAGRLGDAGPAAVVHRRRREAAVVHADKGQGALPAAQCEDVDLQRVQHALGGPGDIVARYSNAHQGRDIHSSETSFQSHVPASLPMINSMVIF